MLMQSRRVRRVLTPPDTVLTMGLEVVLWRCQLLGVGSRSPRRSLPWRGATGWAYSHACLANAAAGAPAHRRSPIRGCARSRSMPSAKWGNVEGAAAFAALVPRPHRAAAVRAMASFQAAYNYLDMLGEQPSADPAANGGRLHSALLAALEPRTGGARSAHGRRTPDYYEHNPQREDGGYLIGLIDACRGALAELPSYPVLAPAARRAAERIVAFQSCNTGETRAARRS
jgi:hypothetical protein